MTFSNSGASSRHGKRAKDNRGLINKVLIVSSLTLVISFFFPRGKSLEVNYQLGDITRQEIVAQFNFPILKDEQKLNADIEAATRNVPYLFERKQKIAEEQSAEIREFMAAVDKIYRSRIRYEESKTLLWQYRYSEQYDKARARAATDSASLYLAREEFRGSYPFDLERKDWDYFMQKTQPNGEEIDYEQFERNLIGICRNRWAEGIFDISKDSIRSTQVAVVARDIPELMKPEDFNDLETAWLKARVEITNAYPRDDDILREIGYQIIVDFMKPNLIFDRETTERRQQDAVAKVPRYQGIILKNERIVDANTRITPEIFRKLDSYAHEIERREKRERGFGILLPWLGRFLLVTIILSFFFSFLMTYRDTLFENNKILLLFSSIFLLMVGVSYLFVFSFNLSEYLIPITVAAMVLTVLFDARTAFIASVTLAILIGFIVGNKIDFLIVALFTSIASIYAVRKLRTRAQLFSAILYIVVSGLVAITSIGILKRADWSNLRIDYLFMTMSGILAPLLTYGLSALFEIIFGVTSDLTLLELSDFNHPLLKRLSREANGTFNHSVVVGNLAESCADAVGANALLCRVGAYYHDIGKMQRPEYFVENQFLGENKHEKLSSTLSARIITSHVKDGLRFAKEYRLPSIVSDFVPMHHGTTRIEYFYQKAVDEAKGDDSRVNESDFRYSGPRPNTKETGILMICEAVEAATRSLKSPNLRNIQAMVNKIIEKRLEEGQLDECPLTMADLAKMKGGVRGTVGLIPVLKGIYHLRIEYPEKKARSKTISPPVRV